MTERDNFESYWRKEGTFCDNPFTSKKDTAFSAWQACAIHPTEPQWISVNDRLPELKTCDVDSLTSSAVLCYMKYDQILVGRLEGYDDDLSWFTDDSEHWNLHQDVTHWMPLPEPPKKSVSE